MSTQAVRAYERHACAFCVALQRLAVRRRDLGLIEAAERLSAEHLAADAERAAFARSGAQRVRPVTGPRGQTEARDGLLISAVTSKTRLPDGRRDA